MVLVDPREDGDAIGRRGTVADGAEGKLGVCVSILLLFFFSVKRNLVNRGNLHLCPPGRAHYTSLD